MSWSNAPLGELCEVVSGATPKTGEAKFWGGSILWTTPKDLSDLETPYLDNPSRTITEDGLRSCAASLLPENSVLLSSRAPIGLVAINRRPMATNQGFKSFVPDRRRLDSKFLYYWLKSNTAFLQNLGNGATFKEISKAVVERIAIPLPPLDEQRRIAAILDKADALRRKRRQVIKVLDSLSPSIFLDMFGEPTKNPKGWPLIEFGSLVENESFKRVPLKSTDRDMRNGPYPYYGASGVIDHIDDFLFDGKRLLIAEDGANLLSRSTPVAFFAEGKFWVNNHAHVVAEKPVCDLTFLRDFIEMIDLGPYVTGSAQPKLNRANLDKIRVPMPPIELQRAYRMRIEQAERLLSVSRNCASKNDDLLLSLQKRAFSGQL